MSTNMKKLEVVPILRALAEKYSSMGDHEKALSYMGRADKLG